MTRPDPAAEAVPEIIQILRQRLQYDAETGVMFWRPRGLDDIPDRQVNSLYNTRRAGKRAFATVNRDGYLIGETRIAGRRHQLMAHRVLYAIHFGHWPDGEIDHINGVRDDNRIANLRVVTRQQNLWNARKPGKRATGVRKTRKGFAAEIRANGGTVKLGEFKTEEMAFAAYREGWRKFRDIPLEDWAIRLPSAGGRP